MDATWEYRIKGSGSAWSSHDEWRDITETTINGAFRGGFDLEFRRKPVKCQGWINLRSVAEELRSFADIRVYCDVPAGEKHPADENGDPLHRHLSIYWGARSVPENETEDEV